MISYIQYSALNKIVLLTNRIKKTFNSLKIRTDILAAVIITAFANMALLHGGFRSDMIFIPSRFIAGEWWRLFTHPFIHVTWYHLALDAGAFLILYAGLEEKRLFVRILYVGFCGLCSLGAALLFSTYIYENGLCGLSGIAHGLTAVLALEMMQTKKNYYPGLISFAVIILKCIYEVITREAFFSFMHLGMCGVPIVACHAGGVMGGVIMFYFINKHQKR